MSSKGSKEEIVNGAKIAADILSSMPSSRRERLLSHIRDTAPELTKKIEENLVRFENIADLNEQGMQLLIKEIDSRDLILSLTQTTPAVVTAIYQNMSERKREILRNDATLLNQVEQRDVEEAQLRIIRKMEALRTAGKIRTESKHDAWA